MKRKKEFYECPEKYLSIDEVGDLHIQWLFERYAALRLLQKIPIFEKAYNMLTERKCYSKRSSFGEMHCDGYLWIEKCKDIKVIIEERQSYKFIYILSDYEFHIRNLWYEWNHYEKSKLKGITVNKFREQGFKPKCTKSIDRWFKGFTYGDCRDDGYIASMDLSLPTFEKVDAADRKTLGAINSIKWWEFYLDNPDELE